MFRLIWIASIHVRSFIRRWMPTNILLDKLRARRGLKYGPLALLLAIAYFYLARVLTVIIDDGAPRWLYLIALVLIWNGLKMLWIVPTSLILLAKVRWNEKRQQRVAQQAQGHEPGSHPARAPMLAGSAS
ncbi:sulfate permease [Paramicrobacterium fandaimingii]|uniref:sulfate permease n=1 Tax=Paramicrobacterium fandaimingii TaxID=2708079 RepID=UPI00141F2B0B|nr:sulfate permease [Microbacterium fandaimingii]